MSRPPAWSGRVLPALVAAIALALLPGCPPKHDYPDGTGLRGQLEREVIALQQTVRTLEYELEHCDVGSEPTSLYHDLYQLFTSSEVQVDRDGSITVLTLPADFVFSRGTDLRDEARMSLDLAATAINLHPEHAVIIEGHTDNRPPSGDLRRLYADNWALSFARAEAVMRAFVEHFDVAPERFTVQARAAYDPIATNDTEAGRKRNRRVVVRIVPPPRSFTDD